MFFPDLVLTTFTDFYKFQYGSLTVGGVDGQEWGPIVYTCIMYKIPCMVHGQLMLVTFGLAETSVANTLLGRPFQVKAGMVYAAADKMVTSTIINVPLPVMDERPIHSNVPPVHGN